MKGRGIFIPEIPFFEDYILFMRVKHEAKLNGENNVRFYIIKAVQEYLDGKNGGIARLNTVERFHMACQKQARVEGFSVAQLVEKACAEKMGEIYRHINTPQIEQAKMEQTSQKKGSFFDLNRDSRK